MSVTVKCSTNDLAVGLDPAAQQLRYTIEADGDLVFTLRSEKPATLLDDVSHPLVRVWPLDDSETPSSTQAVHVLSLAFGQGGTLRWLIEKLDGDDVVPVRDCRYSSQTPGDRFFDALTIFIS